MTVADDNWRLWTRICGSERKFVVQSGNLRLRTNTCGPDRQMQLCAESCASEHTLSAQNEHVRLQMERCNSDRQMLLEKTLAFQRIYFLFRAAVCGSRRKQMAQTITLQPRTIICCTHGKYSSQRKRAVRAEECVHFTTFNNTLFIIFADTISCCSQHKPHENDRSVWKGV